MKIVQQLWLSSLLFISLLSSGYGNAHPEPSSTKLHMEQIKNLTKEWVGVEKTRSKEQKQSHEQQENLEQLQAVLQQQLEEWKTQMALVEKNMSRADEERQTLIEQKENVAHAREAAFGFLKKMERQIAGLTPSIPAPLAQELEVPLQQLKKKSTPDQWLTRYQACLSIAKGMSSFHRRYASCAQDIELANETISVKVIYLGLSRAYFINLDGSKAGTGTPHQHGWTWEEHPELNAAIKLALEITEQTSTRLSLIELPVEMAK